MSELHHADIVISDKDTQWSMHYVSLSKLTGRTIVDVLGHIGSPYGEDPCYMASRLLLDDGSTLFLQGEHDEVYVHDYSCKILPDDETMLRLYREDPDYEDENEEA